jgi:hypothetical protein
VALGVVVMLASHDLFFRVEIALFAGSAVSLAVMGALLLRRLAQRGPLRLDEGDLIEAMHEIAIEP